MKKKRFFLSALMASVLLIGAVLFSTTRTSAQIRELIGLVEEIIETTKEETYCRCKKGNDGVKGCYAGNAISFRVRCAKGKASGTPCHDSGYDGDCR